MYGLLDDENALRKRLESLVVSFEQKVTPYWIHISQACYISLE